MKKFEFTPKGPFDLLNQNQYFGGWLFTDSSNLSIVMPFPVEGWKSSAAVVMRQEESGNIVGEVFGAEEQADKACEQALAVLSLDVDGNSWPEVGKKDPIIGNLQEKYHYLRPVLFHSPYEAAASFIIGHRISMRQGRTIRQSLSETLGDKIEVNGKTFYAFPRPKVLKGLTEFKSLIPEKIERLHQVADAAINGLLDRNYLRSLPLADALVKLKTLRGVGDFFAQGILLRGAGVVDDITDDEMTKKVVKTTYKLTVSPDQNKVIEISKKWKPFKMWVLVLLHVWVRREGNFS